MEPFDEERAPLPRNMIENSMFEEEPDVVDLAKETTPSYPLDPDDVVYEPRTSRLLVRGLAENDADEEEEDYESSARLLGMSFMNRSSNQRTSASAFTRQEPSSFCSMPSTKTLVAGVFILVLVASMVMVVYFLPGCTFTKDGCKKSNASQEVVFPISESGEPFPWADLRLPGVVVPVHYDILLHPNLTTMTFQGTVSITMTLQQDTDKLILHSSNLKISRATFEGKEVKPLEYKLWQQIAITFPKLKKGQQCTLKLDYSANLSNRYDGFYNSSYLDTTGTRRVLAATQFEPLAARKAFPCFDEPAFKATFSVKIKREARYISLSNMPKTSTTPQPDGLLLDEFEKSVTMSTYLVAFIVANMSSVSRNVSGTEVSVYAVPDKKDQVHYALDSAAKLLEFYNGFFDIDYPLSKLDMVAIPDFLAGAMENWGLITFRETTLLVGNHSSPLDKQLVTSVIAHELAHQWFGNLVTMMWWNDLWLNEGFASYMQYMSIEKLFPELDIDNEFLNVRFRALAKDSLNSSHPISSVVKTPEQVEEMFDSVSYEKGASILLMVNSTLNDGEFRKGVIEYLKKFKDRNTVNEDLWNSLSSVSKLPFGVAEMMNTWTLQKGFPLVTVDRTGSKVKLSQEHFLLDAGNFTSKNLWHIPLTYVNDSCSMASGCKQVFLLKEKSANLDIPAGVKWLKFNYKNEGFYIVDYGVEGWKALIDALQQDVNILSHDDRAALVNNMFMLSRLGKVSFRQVLNLLAYMSNETETAPLTEGLGQLMHILRMLEKRQDLNLVGRMKAYIIGHFQALMDSQLWEEESSVAKQTLRFTLLEISCSFNRGNCTDKAMAVFHNWVASNGTEHIPGDLMRVVFTQAAKTEDGWNTLLQAYRHSIYDLEKRKMLEALASTQNVSKIVWILKAGLSGSVIQNQELPLVISTVCKSFAGYLYAWNFVKENWEKITQR
ncbi:leucyl-cystinyl aminopeptidase-like isoform X1 [Clupea harengus]|uniref:Aminopeptidase n=2 Tax=Clupea harengus TaxID=7950 RepID=A0A8M1KF75_CLUHA|nr:leucyl-cystinyl aminopeptidase-like isoform X1 [Clupea harengus]